MSRMHNCTYTPPYVFVAWYLIKHRNFIVFLVIKTLLEFRVNISWAMKFKVQAFVL
jgi:hypothetical protein